MARYIGPQCKHCRREGEKLCNGVKCAFLRRKNTPGEAGARGQRVRHTEYGLQLRAKQKARRTYGVLEQQFRNAFKKASIGQGDTGENLLKTLELRLDNVVYRMNLAPTRPGARQLVSHGHIYVNGKKVTIPSCRLHAGDEVMLKEKTASREYFVNLQKTLEKHETPVWLSLDPKALTGKISAEPTLDTVDHSLDLQMIVEYYSR